MSTARSAGLPSHASFGGLGTTPGRKAPVLSHVLGSPTHPAGRLDSFTTGSLSFSFGSSDHSFNNPALKGGMRCQPTVRTSRPRGAPGAGLKAATSSFSLSSVPAPPTMVKSMSLPVGEFPRRSFVCRLDEFSQKTGLPRVTSSSAIAPLQNSPPPKAPKPTPPSRKRPRYPRGGPTEDVKASVSNSGSIITATSTSLSAPTTPAFAPQPMPPMPPACNISASTQMSGFAAPPAFGPTGVLPNVNDDDDESEILSYLISSDGFESLVSSLQDHNDSPMSPPRQLPRPAVALPGVASDVHANHHSHVHAGQSAGLCTQMDGLGAYGSPDIPRAKPAFTTSPFERVRLDCDDTPGTFSLRDINERINSPGLLRSRTNSLDSARPSKAAASASICSFRPIDPQGDVLHAFPMVVPPVEEFRHEEVPCDLSEDEVGIEIDDEDDQDPLSGSTVEMLFNAFSEAEAAHAAQQQQAQAHAHAHSLTYAPTHHGVHPAAAGACVQPAAGGHAHAASYPPTSMSVLLDTTGCGLGPVEQLRSFSPSILFSGDVPEHTMTL